MPTRILLVAMMIFPFDLSTTQSRPCSIVRCRAGTGLIKAPLRLLRNVFRKRALQSSSDIVVQMSGVSSPYYRCIEIRVGQGEAQGELESAHTIEQVVQTRPFPTFAHAGSRQHVVWPLPVGRRAARDPPADDDTSP